MASQDILDLLINGSDIPQKMLNDYTLIIHQYYRLLRPSATTRLGYRKSLTSCRLWQLLLALLTLYNGRGGSIEKYLIQNYNKIISNKCSNLYQIIVNNYFVPRNNIGGIVFDDALNEQLKPVESSIYYMCICEEIGNGFAGPGRGYGAILHYFTVFYKNDNWYLNSAYSDEDNDICIPQYTTPIINIDEFKSFVTDFVTEIKWEEFKNYFLRDSESDNIRHVLFNMGNYYKVGLITEYIPLLESCIGLPSTGGKTKNTIKNKAKRFINRKTKHAIKHKPKSFINRKTKHTIKHRKLKRKYYTIGHLK